MAETKKKPDFNNLQLPPMWTGVAGQGSQQIFSLGGKWHKAGDIVGDGYKVVGMDANGGLALSWNGLPVSMKLQQGTVTPYTPPQANPYQTAQQSMGLGMPSNTSNPISGGGAMSDMEIELLNGTDSIYKSVTMESMDQIRANTQQSPHMTDEDKSNILHYDEYMEGVKNKTLKKGVKYFVPAMQDDGNVDFHIFMDQR
jgi:hypothetical protein